MWKKSSYRKLLIIATTLALLIGFLLPRLGRSSVDTFTAAQAAENSPPPLAAQTSTSANGGSDWPRIFGPNQDSYSDQSGVQTTWPDTGPPELWRADKGIGYSGPAIVGSTVYVFYREKDEEVVAALNVDDGKPRWRFAYPTTYVDRYGYNGGPRCTPVIAGDSVFTYGAEGKLHSLDRHSGAVRWYRWINQEYDVEQGFFGVGATPLYESGRLIINLGAKAAKAGIVAVDAETGKTLWQATEDGGSYATPRSATIHDRRYVFVFTEAGLVSLDPESGKVHWSIPFRSKLYESVNATSPAIAGDVVFVSATYRTGGLAVRVGADGNYQELWRNLDSMDSHFSNHVVDGNDLYGFAGRHENGSTLRCIDLMTGKVKWRWETPLGRGSMLRVGNRLILWGERGHLVSLDVDNRQPISRSHTRTGLLRPPCWTPPALADGRLYLCDETTLLCLDLRPTKREEDAGSR